MAHTNIERLVGSYENDDIAQLMLVLERLEDCLAALDTERLSQLRGTLILLDHLAETLLSRHMTASFERGGEGRTGNRTFSTKERRALRRSFAAKLELAAAVGDFEEGLHAVIDLDQHAALKLAHQHRNGVYHHDRHKPGVLLLLVTLQLDAVCRLWPEVTPDWIIAGVTERSRLATLSRYGVEPQDTRSSRREIRLPDATHTIATRFTRDLDTSLLRVVATLAYDLLDRAEVAHGVMAELMDDGMEPERIFFIFSNAEFWRRFQGDQELIDLTARASLWSRRHELAAGGEAAERAEEDMALANGERNRRVIELRRDFRPRADPGVLADIYDYVDGIDDLKTPAEALGSYAELDERLDALEEVLPDAVRAWDRMVEDAINDGREK